MAENEARRETDALLRELEREINREYRQAEEELRAKLRRYLADYERKDRIKREQVKRGIISEDEYVRWRMGQLAIGQRWQEQLDVITKDMRNAGEIAHSVVDGYMPSVYAINHNYATYEAEKGAAVDTSYTLYSREAVERIMREDPELLPAPGRRVNSLIAQGKANRWDRKVVQSSMVQGILQGESIPNIATRISHNLGETNRKAALRYARTMTTGAENAGHVDAYERAQSKGIDVRQMWLATLDERTRDSHRELDGETIEPGGTFSNGCRYPGDPAGPAEEIWNCRCRVIAQVKGFDIDPTDPTVRRSDKLNGMSYEEWREAHGVSEPIEKPDEIARRMRYAYGSEYRKGMKGVDLSGVAPAGVDNGGKSGIIDQGEAPEGPGWVKPDIHAKREIRQGFEAFPEGDILKQRIQKVEPDGDLFDVAMHGAYDGVGFGTRERSMTARELAKVIRADPNYHGQNVRLLSCNTGKRQEDIDYCFAEHLANALGVEVKAPDDTLYFTANGKWYVGDQKREELETFKPNERRRIK